MLHIYPVVLDWIASLKPVIRSVGEHDRNLADQLRRSATSVGLNLAEGMGAVAGNKRKAYRYALQEMREAVMAVDDVHVVAHCAETAEEGLSWGELKAMYR